MEIKKIEEGKNKFVFEIDDVSHGFCNMLKERLLEDSHVKTATYKVEHPLINIPKFLVETDGANPRNAVLSAVKKLKTFADKTRKDLSKELK
ncbi:DNA-directed RNA polymerase subunit L [Candidatus Woesearchaeota archaeon B3_Woes]|nr:MAG: DNA-directed RNA polymerase subunit L [Candidatus Woesearchaeota archaeon B3_Woes]